MFQGKIASAKIGGCPVAQSLIRCPKHKGISSWIGQSEMHAAIAANVAALLRYFGRDLHDADELMGCHTISEYEHVMHTGDDVPCFHASFAQNGVTAFDILPGRHCG